MCNGNILSIVWNKKIILKCLKIIKKIYLSVYQNHKIQYLAVEFTYFWQNYFH